jgi:ATP-dependent DNA helicase RecG
VRASAGLRTPLEDLKGVGPERAAAFRRAGLTTFEDLLLRFPFRYEDRSHPRAIGSLRPGETLAVTGEVLDCGLRLTRRPGFKLFHAVVGDGTGRLRVAWLNQKYMREVVHRGQRLALYGEVERGPDGLQLTNPDFEILKEDEAGPGLHTGRIVPVYEKIAPLTTKHLRRLVREILDQLGDRSGAPPPAPSPSAGARGSASAVEEREPRRLDGAVPDPLPDSIRRAHGFPDRMTAFVEAHFPPDGTSMEALERFRTPAQQRLIFEEYFLFALGMFLRRRASDAERKPRAVVVNEAVREEIRRVVPFVLTPGQSQAVEEILADLQRSRPMNRLLQGDVGSGKTVVALAAAVAEMAAGFQVALMAPTEILAEQHDLTFERLLAASRFRVALLTGGMAAPSRREALGRVARGEAQLVVGTHALLEEGVAFHDLGLVIIDEQHRFGVLQRADLRQKAARPDVLVMTATPIPRTLALTLYADLDVSCIRDMPPGRRPVRTTARPESRREAVYAFVRGELEAGRQAYVVYPLVDESSKLDVKAATSMADHLAEDVFPGYRVGLLHGQLPTPAKDRVMRAFASGGIDLLVATTVIEVGIDVPNATVMVVEHAERFGLAQLHQLRGRVGRGSAQAHCVLLYQAPLTRDARARLKAIAETTDGFAIAERDLEIRGMGDFFGTRQAGVPTFRVGDLVRDHDLLVAARREAAAWLAAGGDGRVGRAAEGAWAERFGLVGVG